MLKQTGEDQYSSKCRWLKTFDGVMQVHGQLKGDSKGNTSSHEALTLLYLVALRVARHGCNRLFTSCALVEIWILAR